MHGRLSRLHQRKHRLLTARRSDSGRDPGCAPTAQRRGFARHLVANRVDVADKHQAPRRLESHRITLRRAGSGAALLVIVGLTGCSFPGIDAPSPPLNVNDSDTITAAPTTSTSTRSGSTGLPPMKHFLIGGDGYGPVQDCQVDGTAVTCKASWDDPYQADTYTGSFTGTLSGMEMTGTSTTNQTGHDATDPDCLWQMQTSAPLAYTFHSDGAVSNRQEPGQWRMTHSGSCSGTESGSTSAGEGGSERWTVIE